MGNEPTLAERIADQLGETKKSPRYQIERIIALCGEEFAQAVLQETLEVEGQGGLMVNNGSRRRTPGGVFFYLARGKMTPEQNVAIFGTPAERRKRRKKAPPASLFPWAERMGLLQHLLEKPGNATTIKVVLVGRPAKVKRHKDGVVVMMPHRITQPSFPRGVPRPPDTPTTYTVHIGAKQWNKVEASLSANPDDLLVVEGQCVFDPTVPGVVVFVTSATTKLIQQAQREAQRAQAQAEGK